MSETVQTPTLKELFEHAIQLELQAGRIYRELADRFAHHQQAATLWQALAADEDAHAEMLTQALESVPADKLANQAPAAVWAKVAEILRLMSRKPQRTITNLADAYELAHQLEHSEINAVFEFLSVDVVPGKIEREFVRTQVIVHQQRLTEFRENYSGADWCAVIPQ